MTKERIVNQALDEVNKRVSFLKNELFTNDPLSKQVEVHRKFGVFLNEVKGKERLTEKSIKFIDDLDKEMKKHKKRAETYDSNKIQSELVKLEGELTDLINEKYNIEQDKKRRSND